MKNCYKLLSLFLLLFGSVTAQMTTFSPYTRFGVGDLNQSGFGLSKALGGSTVGIRLNNDINYLNPASYSARDTLSFLFDFGVYGSLKKISSGTDFENFNEAGFDHLAISFPVTKWWGAAIGILPYSKVGYKMSELKKSDIFQSTVYQVDYYGSGGLNQFFIGSGFNLGKYVSVGGNLSYIFGRINRNREVSVRSEANPDDGILTGTAVSVFKNEMNMANVSFSFGLQGYKDLGKNHHLVIGLVLDNKTRLNGDLNTAIYSDYSLPSDTSFSYSDSSYAEIPLRFGAGFSYTFKNKLTFAFDFIRQDWSDANFFGQSDSLTKSEVFRFGIQYSPVGLTEVRRAKYWQRINLRVGGYFHNTYLQMDGNQIKDYGMTFGLGIPWRNEKNLLTNSSFNISYQIGRRGTTDKGLIQENYHVFSIGLTLYDFWFIKPKYD